MNQKINLDVKNFAELFAKLMTEEKLDDKTVAKQITKLNDEGHATNSTIVPRTVERWRKGENLPNKREYILQMIKALRLSERGQIGLEIANTLLDLSEHQQLKTDEQKKYFPDLPLNSPPKKLAEPPLKLQWFAYDEHWVGREKAVESLTEKTQDASRVLMILGLTGIGKTALAERLAINLGEWLENDWTNRLKRANFDYSDKPTDFVTVATRWLEEWGEKLAPEEVRPERLLPRLVKRLCDNRTLVLIDSLERLLTGGKEDEWGDFADQYWQKFFLEILSAESCASRIIITSQDLPTQLDNSRYQGFLYKHVLSGLDENEQVELFKCTGFDVSTDSPATSTLFRLGKAYKGHPLVLRVILGEIIEDFGGIVENYWNEVATKVVEVENAIAEAEADANKAIGSQDEWQLHKLTRKVKGQVNRERLKSVFTRLSTQVRDAYILICASSVYRIPVQQEGWKMQLAALVKRLEKQECSPERQKQALEELNNRFLAEKSRNHNGKPMLGQHNLIRSVALEHHKQLIAQLQKKDKS